ncbi:MAG: DUF881 domain-containing protein [Actinomycetota bacterium]|nr:DUF881 domain-containing protein [Actinomycetota bacterium]
MTSQGRQEQRAWWRRLLWPRRTSRSWGWRFAAPAAFACAGLLAATSAINARGTDLRGGRNTSLIEIVGTERAKVEAQQRQTQALQEQVTALSKSLSGGQIDVLQGRIDTVGVPAGLRSLTGPGIVVTLNDAPRGEEVPEGTDPNLLVVHQQDIQAVANALWSGGAEGISLQGNRIISTTGIKCVGNTVVLQGVPYAPPYRIIALGHVTTMYQALRRSPEVNNYRDYVPPPYNLGWSVRTSRSLRVPGYAGPIVLEYAQPANP